ncbi:TolC family protein [Puteibacter caeruleilacunae]|nr:TolC family protein [Puteibacter caeruleilacunae]
MIDKMKQIKILALGGLLLAAFSFQGMSQEALTLEQSRKLALEYNHKIKIADELIAESESNVSLAMTQFLPNLSFSGSYNYMHDIDDIAFPGFFLPTAESAEAGQKGDYSGTSDVYFPGLNMKMGNIDYFRGGLSLSQPIYMGGKIRSAYNMTKIGRQISHYNRNLQTSDVIVETDQAYWNMVSIKEKVQMADKYVEMLTALVNDLQNAYDLELTTKNELLKAKVQLNQAKLNQFKTANGYELSKMALCQVIGKDLMSNVEVSDTVVAVDDYKIQKDYMGKALAQRPELLMLGKQVELNAEEVKSTNADYMPQLGAGASYTQISDVNDLIESTGSLMVQAQLSVPIFHWRERKHKVAAAKHRKAQQELELERTRDLIQLEVQQSYFNLLEANKQIELAETSMDQAEENVTLMKNSFYEGVANTTELLDAQAFWQQAYSELIDAKINFKLREVSFLKAIGELTK